MLLDFVVEVVHLFVGMVVFETCLHVCRDMICAVVGNASIVVVPAMDVKCSESSVWILNVDVFASLAHVIVIS